MLESCRDATSLLESFETLMLSYSLFLYWKKSQHSTVVGVLEPWDQRWTLPVVRYARLLVTGVVQYSDKHCCVLRESNLIFGHRHEPEPGIINRKTDVATRTYCKN
jgi:hypothetical protein